MFQGYEQTLQVPFPNKGINTTSNNDPQSAKYLQNMLLGNNNMGKVRNGTYLESQFAYNANRVFRDIIHGTSFLKIDGTTENIVYVNYLTVFPDFVDRLTDVDILGVVGNPAISLVQIDLTGYTANNVAFLQKRIYEGSYLYVVQPVNPAGADIFNVNYNLVGNQLSFNISFPPNFFNMTDPAPPIVPVNNFTFWYERGGLFKQGANGIFTVPSLVEDLDPNVIISSINYQNYLLIANGIDPVQVYDGNTIVPLMGNTSIAISGALVINALILTVTVSTLIKAEYVTNLTVGSSLTFLIANAANQVVNITNIIFTDIANNLTTIAITCNVAPNQGIRNILYKKPVPPFNYLAVGHNRLWALAEGRPLLNQFRPPTLCQKVYFAAKQASVFDWFNERTANIDFIDLSVNNYVPENIEVIKFFEGKMLFIGRHTTQIWAGNDPTSNFDGQNIQLGNFVIERVFPLGIFQRSLCQEMPNNFAIISTFGKSYSFYRNEFGQIDFTQNFIDPVRDYLEAQLAFINNDRDYREMTTFFYPYKDLLGIKIKKECLVYQVKNKGFWTVFTENFSDARSYFYNEITKNLYLGMNKGILLTYADKVINQLFTDYDIINAIPKRIVWRIVYSWIYPPSTWYNAAMFLSTVSLNRMPVNVIVCENNSESDPIDSVILINQSGARFDANEFLIALYTTQTIEYSHERVRFNGESFMLELNGFISDYFVFDKVILAGGIQNAN